MRRNLDDNTIIKQSVTVFTNKQLEDWESKATFRIEFIPDSVPPLNKYSILEKCKKRPGHYFTAVCTLRKYCEKYRRGFYSHSIQLLFANKWQNPNPNSLKSFQKEIYDDIIQQIPHDKLLAAQVRYQRSEILQKKGIKPKIPDVWIPNTYPDSIFIESKRINESFQDGQIEGLGIIRKYLGCEVMVDRVCSEEQLKKRFGSKTGFKDWLFDPINITGFYDKL
jgi:hypothetical protein